ncbi:MAG: ABC transporter permease [Acidimicrobiales bacterium]
MTGTAAGTAAVRWLREVPQHPARAIGLTLAALYVFRVWTTATDAGQLFNFTVIGIAQGCVYAIAASGLVLTYATTGVFNYAHGAVGMMAGYLYWSMTVQHDVPVVLALLVVLLLFAPIVGLVTERIMRSFRDASVETTVVVTIAMTILLIGVAQRFWQSEAAALPRLFGSNNIVHIWKAIPTYDDIAAFVLAVAVALLLRALLFGTRAGVAMRAVVDNPTLAALNGAPPVTIARYSWILGSVLAAVAGVLLASGTNFSPIDLTFFIVAAYGAAVVGKLKSIPLTFAGAIALGLIKNHALFAMPSGDVWSSVRTAIPGIFLLLALLLVPAARLTVGRIAGRRAPSVPGLGPSLAGAVAFVGAMAIVAEFGPADRFGDMTKAVIYGVLLLSLVVLTGYSGQISLCQYVFMAIGAWAMGKTFGGNSLVGMLLAGLAAVPLGVLVAVPAIRLQGLYLALGTFGFAVVSKDLVLNNPEIFGKRAVQVGRLDVPGISFAGNRAFFLLCAIVFAVAGVAVLAIRRAPFGRRLAALRDSQAACATLGLDVRRTKLAVFAVSAFIAGVAGALLGGNAAVADGTQFEPVLNIVLLLFAVVGGVTTVTGAFIGGVLFAMLPYVQSEYPDQAGLVFALVAVGAVALGRQPNGLAGMLYEPLRNLRRTFAASASGPAGRDELQREVAGAPA